VAKTTGVVTLVRRDFIVDAPLAAAWDHLARVEAWPSWARHIRQIRLDPPGPLTAGSRGVIRLKGGIRSTFRMTELDPPRSWKWAGPFLWVTVHYDHRFEPAGERRTRLVFVVEAEGLGASVVGRLFGALYARNLDRAIPNLVAEVRRMAFGG
jgi:hypothetical protein